MSRDNLFDTPVLSIPLITEPGATRGYGGGFAQSRDHGNGSRFYARRPTFPLCHSYYYALFYGGYPGDCERSRDHMDFDRKVYQSLQLLRANETLEYGRCL